MRRKCDALGPMAPYDKQHARPRRHFRVWGVAITAALALSLTGCLVPGAVHEARTEVEGSYDAVARYDMSALSGAVQARSSAWVSPSRNIRQALERTVSTQFGADVAHTVAREFGAGLEREIASYLAAQGAGWMSEMPEALGRVESQLRTVDLQSTLVVAPGADGQYDVRQLWSGISVFQDPSCRQMGGLLCDQIHISTGTVLGAEYPLEIISAASQAALSGDGALELKASALEFNYGRIALYLLIDQLFPRREAQEGAGFRELALAAVNCRGMAGRLAGEDGVLGWDVGGVRVGLSLNDLMGTCEQGMLSSVNRFVDQFHIPLQFETGGRLQLVDIESDGRIDQMDGPQLEGTMQTGAGSIFALPATPISGQMTAFRVGGQ